MATHDPFKVLETLRDHLTQPETNIIFLFGAGTSCSVRVPISAATGIPEQDEAIITRPLIPDVTSLTNISEREIRKLDAEGEPARFGPALDAIDKELRQSIPPGRKPNIEDILSCLRRKLQAVGDGDRLSGLNKADLVMLEQTVQGTIAAQVNPDRSSFPDRLPHDDFVKWIARMPRGRPVEIFTTNYDVLIETALEAERVPAFDGFVGCNQPFFSHESLTRPENAP